MEPSENNRFEKNITVEKKKKKLLLSFTAESGYGYVLKRLSGKKRRTKAGTTQPLILCCLYMACKLLPVSLHAPTRGVLK